MLIKLQYIGGYLGFVDSNSLSYVSLPEYIANQFHFDEYSLKCESVEIDYQSNLVFNAETQAWEVPVNHKWRPQFEIMQRQNNLSLNKQKMLVGQC